MPFLDPLHQVKIEPGEPGYKRGEESRLTKRLRYFWVEEDREVYAAAGAINNGASIPTIIPDILLSDHGKIDKPAALHDDIYRAYLDLRPIEREAWEKNHGPWTRKEADDLLRAAAKDEGVNFVRRWVIWSGVRMNVRAGYRWGKS
jgi:hypothetical protein